MRGVVTRVFDPVPAKSGFRYDAIVSTPNGDVRISRFGKSLLDTFQKEIEFPEERKFENQNGVSYTVGEIKILENNLGSSSVTPSNFVPVLEQESNITQEVEELRPLATNTVKSDLLSAQAIAKSLLNSEDASVIVQIAIAIKEVRGTLFIEQNKRKSGRK